MRKIFVVWLVLTMGLAQAQDPFKTVAEETCQCVTDLKSNKIEINDMQLGLCMVKSYSAHKSEFPAGRQVSLTDGEAFESIAAEVGMKMVEICPDIIMQFAGDNDLVNEFHQREISVSGQVADIRQEQFVTIELKDNNGRKYSLLLLHYFDTAGLYTEGKIKKGDKIQASYTEIELFDPKMKEFRTFKVLTNLAK